MKEGDKLKLSGRSLTSQLEPLLLVMLARIFPFAIDQGRAARGRGLYWDRPVQIQKKPCAIKNIVEVIYASKSHAH